MFAQMGEFGRTTTGKSETVYDRNEELKMSKNRKDFTTV